MPIFATHGILQIIVPDNEPFNSFEFRRFANSYGFDLITTPDHYSRSNVQTERAEQVAKKNAERFSQILRSHY